MQNNIFATAEVMFRTSINQVILGLLPKNIDLLKVYD